MKKGFRKSIILVAGLTATLTFGTAVSADTIKVNSGDTLYSLSHKYNVSIDQIKAANGLLNNTIYAGQSINIPTAASNNQTYKVKSGDSLWKISKKYGTSVKHIKQLNQLSSDIIYPGQTLTISGQAPAKTNSYQVKKGDTLYSISKKYNVSIANLKSWNGLSSNTIYPGQTLTLKAGSFKQPAESKTSLADNIITDAKKYIGTPYVWAGSTPAGFDCSGFLNYVFTNNGINISRTVATIYNEGTSVSSPKRGDLVFFETYKAGPSHAGIYLGDGTFIHASTSKGVTISSMDNSYWKQRYLGAKSYY